MPRVVSHTPPWLSRPSPGAQIFSDPEPQSPASPSKKETSSAGKESALSGISGPRKLLANRGTEIFTVVGNKIRWADLGRVQDEWEEHTRGRREKTEHEVYRTLVAPVYYQITQLLISPSGQYLAICTQHTVHIAVLPDSFRLADNDRSPLKLKTYQLGPTTHVIPESPLASVLWHPLAASTDSTDCLVTVTTEAAVRVWEIDRANNWSFERPALAIDLRKLADGVSSDQDFEPSGFGKNRGFSVDAFDMEVSAACFGGQGSYDEDAWASMTLWTAMSNGDVYALCPLLPSRWRPTSTTIPALSISAVSQIATFTKKETGTDEYKAAEQQYEWVQEIDNEDPAADLGEEDDEIRYRPQNPSAIPRLQGPFELDTFNQLDEGEITDIYAIAARLDEELLLSGEDDYEVVVEGMQFTTICLANTKNQVMIALELEGVSGQWLPKKGRSTFSVPTSEAQELVLLDTININPPTGSTSSHSLWPTFTPDTNNTYGFFVTSTDKIRSISISDWASRVGIESGSDAEIDAGLQTRLAVACQTQVSVVQDVYTADSQNSTTTNGSLSAPVLIDDPSLGQMLLSCLDGQACAVLFDSARLSFSQSLGLKQTEAQQSSASLNNSFSKAIEGDFASPVPTRSPYAPSEVLYKNQLQPYEALRQRIPASRKPVLVERPVRLSPACLDIMTLAHKTFSAQTSSIEQAAAELFRRCERLREELADQVRQMSELADRIQNITEGSRTDNAPKLSFDARLVQANERQKKLVQRYEALRRKSGRVGVANQELSTKEQGWIDEIDMLSRNAGVREDGTVSAGLSQRYDMVRSLAQELVEQSKQYDMDAPSLASSQTSRLERSDSTSPRKSGLFSISTRMQKERIADVMSMVEREGAIIDAVMSRLAKLNTGSS